MTIIAQKFKDSRNCLFLGREQLSCGAEEGFKAQGDLIHTCRGLSAAEMKHGPIALIDEEMPVVVIATKNSSYEKVISNIQEVKARKGIVLAIVTEEMLKLERW